MGIYVYDGTLTSTPRPFIHACCTVRGSYMRVRFGYEIYAHFIENKRKKIKNKTYNKESPSLGDLLFPLNRGYQTMNLS